MTTAQDIEDNLHNLSVQSDVFDDNDEDWDDAENRPPPMQTDGIKRGMVVAPVLDPIHEESRTGSAGSSESERKNEVEFNEPTDSTQARTPYEPSPNHATEQSFVFSDDTFKAISNVSEELRRAEHSFTQHNRFRFASSKDNERRSWEEKSCDTNALGSLIYQRSYEATNNAAANMSPIRRPSSSQKIFTSTPKGQGRSQDNSFEDCPVSTIQSASPKGRINASMQSFLALEPNDSHTGSTLSRTAIGNALKDMNFEDDSFKFATEMKSKLVSRRNASQSILSGGQVPKKSYIKLPSSVQKPAVNSALLEANMTLSKMSKQGKADESTVLPELLSSRMNSRHNDVSRRSNKEKTLSKPRESVNRTTSSRSIKESFSHSKHEKAVVSASTKMPSERATSPIDSNVLIAVKPEPLSHFGFVAVKESVISVVTVTNLSSNPIQVQGFLKDGVFCLLETAIVIINGNGQHDFSIKFTPDQRARFKGDFRLHVLTNGKQHVHPLLGFGGAAHLQLITNKCLQMCHHSMNYVLFPRCPMNFTIDLTNDGERAGCVAITAVDDDDNALPGISISPNRFTILTKENAEAYKEKWEQSVNVTVRPETLHLLRDRARTMNGRLSTLSRASGTTNELRSSLANGAHLFNLRIVWGDERLRQRAKKHLTRTNGAHPVVHGMPITKMCFTRDEELVLEQNTDSFLTQQDVNIFFAQLRVTTIRVGDDRAVPNPNRGVDQILSRPQSSASNFSAPEGFYIPNEESLNPNASTISIAPSADRTVMPSRGRRY